MTNFKPKRSIFYLFLLWGSFILLFLFILSLSLTEEVMHPLLAVVIAIIFFLLYLCVAMRVFSEMYLVVLVVVALLVSVLYIGSDKYEYVAGNASTVKYGYVFKNPFTDGLFVKKVYRQYGNESFKVIAKTLDDKFVELEFSWNFSVVGGHDEYIEIAGQTKWTQSVTSYVERLTEYQVKEGAMMHFYEVNLDDFLASKHSVSKFVTQRVLSSNLPFDGQVTLKSYRPVN